MAHPEDAPDKYDYSRALKSLMEKYDHLAGADGYEARTQKDDKPKDLPEAIPNIFQKKTKSVIIGYSYEGWGTFLGRRMHESQVNPWQRQWFFPQSEPIWGEVTTGLELYGASHTDVTDAAEGASASPHLEARPDPVGEEKKPGSATDLPWEVPWMVGVRMAEKPLHEIIASNSPDHS